MRLEETGREKEVGREEENGWAGSGKMNIVHADKCGHRVKGI